MPPRKGLIGPLPLATVQVVLWACAAALAIAFDPTSLLLRAEILQEMDWGGVRMRAEYRAAFASQGRFHLDGQIFSALLTGDAEVPVKVTMASNGRKLMQRLQIHDVVQFISYDLEAIRKKAPWVRMSHDLDPRAIRDLVRRSAGKRRLGEDHVGDMYTVVSEIPVPRSGPSVPLPGPGLSSPRAEKLLIWSGKDELPRKAELLNGEGRCVMRTTFSRIREVDEGVAESFEIKLPSGAVELDMTAMILDLVGPGRVERNGLHEDGEHRRP